MAPKDKERSKQGSGHLEVEAQRPENSSSSTARDKGDGTKGKGAEQTRERSPGGGGAETERSHPENSSSATARDQADGTKAGVCVVCALGTKGSHTYQKECARSVAGATVAQMQRAARGGIKGRHRLLLELALQRQDAEQAREEVAGL